MRYCPLFRKGEWEGLPTLRQQPGGPGTDANEKLFCAFCHFHITASSEAVFRSGSHTHTFTNPAGFVYTVHCFGSAPGCQSAGRPTAAHSWFQGFKWQLALCRSCHNHLGWHFTDSESFYALIEGRTTRLS